MGTAVEFIGGIGMLIHTTLSWPSSPSEMSLGSSFTFTELTKLSFSAESAKFITDVIPGNKLVSDDIRMGVPEMLQHLKNQIYSSCCMIFEDKNLYE